MRGHSIDILIKSTQERQALLTRDISKLRKMAQLVHSFAVNLGLFLYQLGDGQAIRPPD